MASLIFRRFTSSRPSSLFSKCLPSCTDAKPSSQFLLRPASSPSNTNSFFLSSHENPKYVRLFDRKHPSFVSSAPIVTHIMPIKPGFRFFSASIPENPNEIREELEKSMENVKHMKRAWLVLSINQMSFGAFISYTHPYPSIFSTSSLATLSFVASFITFRSVNQMRLLLQQMRSSGMEVSLEDSPVIFTMIRGTQLHALVFVLLDVCFRLVLLLESPRIPLYEVKVQGILIALLPLMSLYNLVYCMCTEKVDLVTIFRRSSSLAAGLSCAVLLGYGIVTYHPELLDWFENVSSS